MHSIPLCGYALVSLQSLLAILMCVLFLQHDNILVANALHVSVIFPMDKLLRPELEPAPSPRSTVCSPILRICRRTPLQLQPWPIPTPVEGAVSSKDRHLFF